ncbi:MAG: adenosylcobinamide amidohydrolase [Verrucomicrobiota bacterium]
MLTATHYDALEIHRKEKTLIAKFLKPHRVLSTCRTNGGLREDLEYLFNHQSCEPSSHTDTDLCIVAVKEPHRYLKRIASKAGLPPEKCASLGTAANMNNAAVSKHGYKGLEVIAIATAGVGTNGGRAGDPGSYYQTEDGASPITAPPPQAGTINILVFLNQELTAGATVSAATLIAEAKASVLQELSAPSRYSDGIATGTGTDQIGIASLIGTQILHTDANKHSKTGELIARSVRDALYEALNLQSGLTPDSRRSSIAHLQRFGETQESFAQGIQTYLPEKHHKLFTNNFLSVNHDPITVSTIQALVHLRDQITWKTLPQNCIQEILLNQATLIPQAVSHKTINPTDFHQFLNGSPLTIERQDFLTLIHKAFAYGFERKWQGRFED